MKLTVHTFASLDGVMQGPGSPEEDPSGGFDRGGWIVQFMDEDFGRVVDSWFARTTELLFGRTTYDLMAGYWPQVTDPDNPVAAVLNGRPKHLVSRTVTEPSWANTVSVIADDVVDGVRALKNRPGEELQVHGGWQLVQALHEAGLVDEYRIIEFPVVVGQGKRLFPDGTTASTFDVVQTEVFSSGAVYRALRPTPFTRGAFSVEDGKETTLLDV